MVDEEDLLTHRHNSTYADKSISVTSCNIPFSDSIEGKLITKNNNPSDTMQMSKGRSSPEAICLKSKLRCWKPVELKGMERKSVKVLGHLAIE